MGSFVLLGSCAQGSVEQGLTLVLVPKCVIWVPKCTIWEALGPHLGTLGPYLRVAGHPIRHNWVHIEIFIDLGWILGAHGDLMGGHLSDILMIWDTKVTA